jgi:outer membrane protein OmpA-like peptidoglycan-associated protein
MKVLSRTIAATAVLAAAGCTNLMGGSLGGTFGAESFLGSEMGGSGFNAALAREYQDLAAVNANTDVNWLDVTVYQRRAMAAAGGSPEPLFSPADYGVNGDLEALRGQVMNAAAEFGADRPEACAEMYAMYDRLVEATYQDHGSGVGFSVPNTVVLSQTVNFRGVDVDSVRASFDAAYGACTGRMGDTVVFFGFDSAAITAAADAVIQDISSGVMSGDAVSVVGHADTVGSLAYNQGLSERRARNVANRMVELGVEPAQITTAGRSWTEPAVDTGPNVREPLNRRVEIDVSR